jgi:AraC-like DNA-binding protein
MPLHEITDKDFALDLVWGSEIKELEDRIYHQSKEEAIIAIQQFLLRKLSGSIYQVEPMKQVIAHIVSMQGNVRIDELAYHSNLSERQFNRRFSNMVGLSPKNFAGIIRFQHFFKQAQLLPNQNLGAVALDCGYYDQSHFIREFKQYTGMNPSEYFKQDSGLAAFFLW